MTNVEIIETKGEFEQLRDQWNALLSESEANNIFLTWEWLYTWWEAYSSGNKLSIILVKEEENNLIGIGPFYFAREKKFGVTVYILKLLGSEKVSSEYLDIIVKRDKSDMVVKLMIQYLQKIIEDRNVILFKNILENSLIYKISKQIMNYKNVIYEEDIHTTNPYIKLPKDENLFLENLNPEKKRAIKEIKRRARKLDKEHGFEINKSENRNLSEDFDVFVKLHQRIWQSRGKPGSFSNEKFKAFHKAVAKKFAEKNYLRLYLLFIKGKPVAARYGFQYADKFYGYLSGFDPEWKNYGIGKIMVNYTIAESIKQQLVEFDFLRGNEDYKYDFTYTYRNTLLLKLSHNSLKMKYCLFIETFFKFSKKKLKENLPDTIVAFAKKIRGTKNLS